MLQFQNDEFAHTGAKYIGHIFKESTAIPIGKCPKYNSVPNNFALQQCSWSFSQFSDPPAYTSRKRSTSAPPTPKLSTGKSNHTSLLNLKQCQTRSFISVYSTPSKNQDITLSSLFPGCSSGPPPSFRNKFSNLTPPLTPTMGSLGRPLSKFGSSPLLIPGSESSNTESQSFCKINSTFSPILPVGAPRSHLFGQSISKSQTKISSPSIIPCAKTNKAECHLLQRVNRTNSPIFSLDTPNSSFTKAGSPGSSWVIPIKTLKYANSETSSSLRSSPAFSPSVDIQNLSQNKIKTCESQEISQVLCTKGNHNFNSSTSSSEVLHKTISFEPYVPKLSLSSSKKTQKSLLSTNQDGCKSMFIKPIPVRPLRPHRHVDGRNFQLQWLSHRILNSTTLVQDRWYRMKKYPQSLIGSELVDWLVKTKNASTRKSAVSVGRSLIDAKYMQVTNHRTFEDGNFFYIFLAQKTKERSKSENDKENNVEASDLANFFLKSPKRLGRRDRTRSLVGNFPKRPNNNKTLLDFVPKWLVDSQKTTSKTEADIVRSKSCSTLDSFDHFDPHAVSPQILRSTSHCKFGMRRPRRLPLSPKSQCKTLKLKSKPTIKKKISYGIPSSERILCWSLSPLNISDIALKCLVCHGWRKIISNNFLHDKSLLLRHAYRKGGFSHDVRSRVWSYLVGADNTKWREKSVKIYHNLSTRCPPTQHKIIMNDIKRTLIDDNLLSTDTKQAMMLTLLKAYAMHDASVGYCQGMNFIAGLLARQYDEPDKAFFIFQNIMGGVWNLRSFYIENIPGIKMLNRRYERLMAHYVPDVYQHIKKQQLIVDAFSTGWFISLFIPNVSPKVAEWIFDIFLVDGWNILLQIGLALVSHFKQTLLTLTSGNLLSFLSHLKCKDNIQHNNSKSESKNHKEEHSVNAKLNKNDVFFDHPEIIQEALKFDINVIKITRISSFECKNNDK